MKIDSKDKQRIRQQFKKYQENKEGMECSAEFLVLRKSMDVGQNELWMAVVEKTINKYRNTEKYAIIVRRFFKAEKEVKVFRELHIDRSTYYLWQHEIYEYAYVVAVSKQLLDIE
jgi:hypothetical protein